MESGYASLTTRKVADRAGAPLSQIHYHFGSKHALVLGLLEYINDQRRVLYEDTFSEDLPLHEVWNKAGQVFMDDLESGYTRVMQDLTAAGYSDPVIGAQVAEQFTQWTIVLSQFGKRIEQETGSLGPLSPMEFGALLDAAAIGINQCMLLRIPTEKMPALSALGKFGSLLQTWEQNSD